MEKLNSNNIKIAVQKDGRLTEKTFSFLRSAGLEFETYKKKLFAVCRNFPLEILYVRDDDIPYYVETGIADLGIVGQNLLTELDSDVTELLPLEFGYCSLGVAVLKESDITSLSDLEGCKIATSYPNSTKKFFDDKNISVETVMISGSVEIAPTLGVASAIVDIVATGSTLALNDLKLLTKLYDCEAVLIATKNIKSKQKKELINSLVTRFNGVLAAKNYKYIMMNAPKSILPKLKKYVPGLTSPTISPLADSNFISIQSVVKEDVFWETMETLKKLGASGIIVLPIEKMII